MYIHTSAEKGDLSHFNGNVYAICLSDSIVHVHVGYMYM